MKLNSFSFYTLCFVLIGVLAMLMSLTWDVKFFGDSFTSSDYLRYGALHAIFNIVWISGIAILLVVLIGDITDDQSFFDSYSDWVDEMEDRKEEDNLNVNSKNKFSISKIVWIIVGVLFVVLSLKTGKIVYSDTKNIYNTHIIYKNNYIQKLQERELFYDKMWKTYLQKDKIAFINKETFIEVTKIIMENRADGKNLMWKWNKENQNIPYEKFTEFYEDLSNFVTSQREEYFKIEKECQIIANRNNILLDTFPNNLYNRVLKLEPIEFQYGFISDSTVNVFKNRRENLKN
jgi:uncharacterized membrane protein